MRCEAPDPRAEDGRCSNDRSEHSSRYCGKHQRRLWKHGTIEDEVVAWIREPPPFPHGKMPKTCIECGDSSIARGLCEKHYRQYRRWGRVDCSPYITELCPKCQNYNYRAILGRGMCSRCWRRHLTRRPSRKVDQGFWDRDTCLAAGEQWIKLTGAAPRVEDWLSTERSDLGLFPTPRQVYKYWGSWDDYASELSAPLRLSRQGQGGGGRRPEIWTQDVCIQSGLAYVDIYERLPTSAHWQQVSKRLGLPSLATVQTKFDSWSNFVQRLSG